MKAASVGAGVIAVLLAIQLVPVKRDNPPVESEVPAPEAVRAILKRACYDCHSNETRWPWYARVAPASWLVAYDVHHAREHMNFSTWARYDARKQAKHLEEAWEEIDEGEMPLFYYVWAHPAARLSASDRSALRAWTRAGSGGDDDDDDD
jgi:hypothetical protein